MKKILIGILLFVTGCTSQNQSPVSQEMYLEQAQLTQEEQNIIELVGTEGKYIYDFQLDDTAKSIQFKGYELIDGQWENTFLNSSRVLTDSQGRFLLDFNRIDEAFRYSVQNVGGVSYEQEETESLGFMSITTSYFQDKQMVEYEQEIPLAIQIITTKNEVHSYDVEFFFKPEEYEKYDYEHVYAITVLFSQNEIEA